MPPDEFEELIALILKAEKFENVQTRRGTADEGWDIDALIRIKMPNDRVDIQYWRVECKNHKTSPNPMLVRDHYIRMVRTESNEYVTHVLFVTSSYFTNPTKKDLETFAKKDRIGLDYWEGPDLEHLVEKHFETPYIRTIISPYIRMNISFTLLKKACEREVTSEIECRVGRKYLPELYQSRPLEIDIKDFIESDLEQAQIRDLKTELATINFSEMPLTNKYQCIQIINEITKSSTWKEIRILLQKLYEISDESERKLIDYKVKAIFSLRRNCLLIREKAGSGKTNLLCHLARDINNLSLKIPTLALFFSCKFDISPNYSLKNLIIGGLRAALDYCGSQKIKLDFAKCEENIIRAIFLTLQKYNAQMIIFLDGINENRNLTILDEAMLDIMLRWNHLPLKFIVTCRDIFWNYFSENAWMRFLYEKRVFELPEFGLNEIDGIIEEYFKVFEIKGKLLKTARLKCRHPLLLRFFCEAYKGSKLKEIKDIRLKNLFDEYWKRKREEIATRLNLGTIGIRRVESFLLLLAEGMSSQYTTHLPLHQVEEITKETDLDSEKSLYQRFLDEDIIIEELPPEDNKVFLYKDCRVSFVYEEFYDYIMALVYFRKNDWENKDQRALCIDIVDIIEKSEKHEYLKGVVEYLVLLAEERGHHKVLFATLAKMGCYQILCNALSKLNSDSEWIEEILLLCLRNNLTFEKAFFGRIRKIIKNCEFESLFKVLITEE